MNRDARKKIKILILDNEATYAEKLNAFLSKEGFRTKALDDLGRAVDEFKSSRYQIVFIDLKQAGLGRQALETLQAIDDDVAFIATTNDRTVEEAVDGLHLGVFDYQPKELSDEELLEVVNQAIKRKGLVVDFEKKINLEIGKKIRLLRKERGLTLKQLANRTGLSISLISQIERAKSSSSVSTLYKVATALSVKLEYFFAGI